MPEEAQKPDPIHREDLARTIYQIDCELEWLDETHIRWTTVAGVVGSNALRERCKEAAAAMGTAHDALADIALTLQEMLEESRRQADVQRGWE
jgi:hypothetical protein